MTNNTQISHIAIVTQVCLS